MFLSCSGSFGWSALIILIMDGFFVIACDLSFRDLCGLRNTVFSSSVYSTMFRPQNLWQINFCKKGIRYNTIGWLPCVNFQENLLLVSNMKNDSSLYISSVQQVAFDVVNSSNQSARNWKANSKFWVHISQRTSFCNKSHVSLRISNQDLYNSSEVELIFLETRFETKNCIQSVKSWFVILHKNVNFPLFRAFLKSANMTQNYILRCQFLHQKPRRVRFWITCFTASHILNWNIRNVSKLD